jgi:hypothetical protein
MREGDDCNFCLALLDAHCAAGGEKFCRLKEEYLTTNLPADAMLDKFYAMVSDEQLVRTDAEVRRRMSYLNNTNYPSYDPGQVAAQRWLHNYRYGKK